MFNDVEIDRRQLLGRSSLAAAGLGLAAVVPTKAIFAAAPEAARPDWFLGVGDVAGDVPVQTLTRIHGRAPDGLAGTLYRNGPARFRRGGTACGHWFDGDGMIRAWRINDGKATLTARFIDTPKRRIEDRLDNMVQPGFGTQSRPGSRVTSADDTNAANTSVIAAGGRLLALWEAGSAFAIDPDTLATRGPEVFRKDLAGMPFLAHPRVEPDGRIWNLGLSGNAAFVWRLSAAGQLEAGQAIPLPMGSYIHDFTATARHLVIVLQPWVQDHMALPFVESLSWKPELGSKVLVVDKGDLSKRRLYELPPFAFFHLGDAWEEKDGTIRFDGCFEADPSFGRDAARALVEGRYMPVPPPRLTMVALRPDGRADMNAAGIDAEFPRSEPKLAGLARSQTVHVGGYLPGRPFATTVGIWDWRTGKDDVHDFGARQLVEEFVPVPGGKRRLLMGTTINLDTQRTELHIFDARRVAAGPVASWSADTALPVSFHGNWVGV